MEKEKLITISSTNPKYFEKGDKVALKVLLKNIQQLTVKVFEVDIENYYLKNMREIDESFNVDGLIASKEDNFEFKEPPIQKFEKEFKFDTIGDKESGTYIIEFIGNGKSSRAIIKKGKLLLLSKSTLVGQVLMILNEKYELCKGERTGVHLEGRFYNSNAEGQIILPFAERAKTAKVILMHKGFSSLADLQLLEEQYDFKCSYLYNKESFLMGNKAKILVQPRIYINKMAASVGIIKKPTITVTTMTTSDLPSTTLYDNLKFDHKEEVEIEVPIPANLKEVRISVGGQIKLFRSEQNISSNHTILCNNYLNKNQFCSMCLKFTKDGYFLYVLGKNGEPKCRVTLDLIAYNSYFRKERSFNLDTDDEGKITLGLLEDIMSLRANLRPKGDIEISEPREWVLPRENYIDYPTSLKICEGESFTLPYFGKELNNNKLSFLKILEVAGRETILSNEISKLKIDKNSLIFENLSQGQYVFKFIELGHSIRIEVLKGNYWNGTDLIITKEALLDMSKQFSNVVIEKVDLEESSLKIKVLTDKEETTRVHIFAYEFMPGNSTNNSQLLREKIVPIPRQFLPNPIKKNVYLSNRTISEEYNYVLERKKLEKFIGNTLERPQILLKRTELRETQFEKETLDTGRDFESKEKSEEISAKYQSMRKDDSKMPSYAPKPQQVRDDQINGLLNFLGKASMVVGNLKPVNGVVTLPNFDWKSYSSLEIVATNLYAVAQRTIPLNMKPIPRRDLRHKSNLEKGKYYCVSRKTSELQTKKQFELVDLTSTDYKIVDSIPTLFDLQKELRLCAGSDYENGKDFLFWKFAKEWHTYSIEQKLKVYDDYASHETNLFIYFKDRAFFETYIKTFLKNKMSKTIVDYFLLKDKEKMLELSKIEYMERFNTMEIILCMLFLKEEKMDEQVLQFLSYIENKFKAMPVNTQTFQRLFDTVLTSKSVPETKYEKPKEYERREKKKEMAYEEKEKQILYETDECSRSIRQAEVLCCMEKSLDMPMKAFKKTSKAMKSKGIDILEDLNFGEGGSLAHIEDQRKQFVQEFKNVEKTKEYTERQYYFQRYPNESRNYIPLTAYWVDLAKHIAKHGMSVPFLSSNIIFSNSNHTEMMAALTFQCLSFEVGKHIFMPFKEKGVQITAESNMLIFYKEFKETEPNLKPEIMLSQRIYDPKDRYMYSEEEPDLKVEKLIDEYIIDKIYGCQTIITNSSISSQEFQILLEIPEGAIPVYYNDYSKSHSRNVSSFHTESMEFFFYFPQPGSFGMYPSSVSRRDKVLSIAKETKMDVHPEMTIKKKDTIEQILLSGSKEDILTFIEQKNILNPIFFHFRDIYYLLKDSDFYRKLLSILRKKRVYDHTTWSFSLYHGDSDSFREYIQTENVQKTFQYNMKYFKSGVFKTEDAPFYEYFPLINPRVHQLHQNKSNILNIQLKGQYASFLTTLVEVPKMLPQHWMCLIYYLLLQDRIKEAIQLLQKIDEKSFEKDETCKVQYDYLQAYLDFYSGYPNFVKARSICENYLDYPVLSWRKLFVEVANQIAEYDGEELILPEKEVSEDQLKLNLKNAEKEEVLNAELDKANMNLAFQNVSSITISYYVIDLEVLFSRNPFLLEVTIFLFWK